MINSLSLTIVICTYDRDRLLRKCLSALAGQSISRDRFDVLVIDNKGTSACQQTCTDYSAKYVYEAKTGLSHARNTGYKNTTTQWVFYLDDDGIPNEDLIEQFAIAASTIGIEIIGGRFSHYFEPGAPKWIHHYYRGFSQATNSDKLTELKPGEYLSGGIMAIHRDLLFRIGGFNPDLGMTGKTFGYGEEDEVQDKIRKLGFQIFYHPGMKMSHLVQPHKYSIKSRVQMAYAHGVAETAAKTKRYKFGEFIYEFARILLVGIPYEIARWLFKPKFYWQNAVVNVLSKFASNWGRHKGNF
jgi:glycosyltransferase involved in cell wall biosynthesis